MERISSRQNPIVSRFRDVARGGAGSDWMLLDGAHLVEEALASGMSIDVVATDDAHAEGALPRGAERAGARTIAVTDAVLAALSPVRSPSGIVALARRPVRTLADVFARAPQLVLALHDVQDPGNVGAIVRAAEACGVTGIVTSRSSADPYGWKALRGSMGSAFRMPIASRAGLPEAVARARAACVRVFATVPGGGTPLARCDLRVPSAVLLGGEGAGLPPELIDAADERLTIPMHAPVESLNVSVAAALIAYEAARQRS